MTMNKTKERVLSVYFCHALFSLLFPFGYAGFGFASDGPVQSNMV
jgi:hypothetical protein